MKTVLKLYFKNIFRDKRILILPFLIILPIIQTFNGLKEMLDIYSLEEMTAYGFFGYTVVTFTMIFNLTAIIFASDSISSELSNNSIALYGGLKYKRNQIINAKLVVQLTVLSICIILSITGLNIMLLISEGVIIHIKYTSIFFLIVLLPSILFTIVSMFISAVSKNTILAAIVPLLYIMVGEIILSFLDLEAFMVSHYISEGTRLINKSIMENSLISLIDWLQTFGVLTGITIIFYYILIICFNSQELRG